MYTRIAAVKFRKQVVKTFSAGKRILASLPSSSFTQPGAVNTKASGRICRGFLRQAAFFRLVSHRSTSLLASFFVSFSFFFFLHISFIFVKYFALVTPIGDYDLLELFKKGLHTLTYGKRYMAAYYQGNVVTL